MKTWQKVLVGLGLAAALAVPTGVAIAATDGGDHSGPESRQMMEGHGSMGAMAGHGQAGSMGHEMHGGADGGMDGSMGSRSPMR